MLGSAWEGANPAYLRAYDGEVALTEAEFGFHDDRFVAAQAEGRLFVLDHSGLEDTPTTASFGFDRFISGSVGLFVRTLSGPLMPVAIRTAPGRDLVRPGNRG